MSRNFFVKANAKEFRGAGHDLKLSRTILLELPKIFVNLPRGPSVCYNLPKLCVTPLRGLRQLYSGGRDLSINIFAPTPQKVLDSIAWALYNWRRTKTWLLKNLVQLCKKYLTSHRYCTYNGAPAPKDLLNFVQL